MPGIAGIITKRPAARATEQLARMVARMRHESFYASGTWADEALGVYLGWVDRGDGIVNPQCNERGDRVLVFSGEEYPEPGTAQRLREQGHRVGQGRGAHLVHAAEEDRAFPAGLNGQFHGMLIDRTRGTAMLFNDRHASRRIYYHEAKDAFYFAAEAKALLAVLPELRALDEQGLGEFVACGCVLEDRTLFKGIRILPWAAAWDFRNGRLASKRSYFSPCTWEEQGALEPEAFYRELREVFGRNLPRYFEDAGSVGLSLTGGLDTRMMLALHKPEPQSLLCYTFGGSHRECRDVRIARRIARMCGQRHQVIAVGAEFLTHFPRYAERTVYLTDGATGVEQAADLYVNEIARQIAPVRLTGNYGDEVLHRRVAFRPSKSANGVFHPEFTRHIADGAQTYAEVFRGDTLTHAANQQVSWFLYGLAALESTQLEMRSPFLDNDLIRTLYRAPKQSITRPDVRVRMIRDVSPALARIRTDQGYAGRGGPVAEALSRFWNRATMRAEYACEYGDPRWLSKLDRTLGKRMEKTFVGIHKFTHFSLWYREELADYVRAMLLDPRTLSRPYLQGRELEEMVDRHVDAVENYTPAIHKILTLEHIHRLLIDTP
ncbi:MAG TPA: asparagine synthase-related protein [Terracidiphilus sp.]|jgi:asparagine synthase (glutamine-hydrolysing)|nr:asparagine synthase-related protein [Terracidiphilus sp.]